MPRYTSPHTIKFGIGAMSRRIKKTAQGDYDITRPGDTLGSGPCVENRLRPRSRRQHVADTRSSWLRRHPRSPTPPRLAQGASSQAAPVYIRPEYRKNKATFDAVPPARVRPPPAPCARWCPRLGAAHPPHAAPLAQALPGRARRRPPTLSPLRPRPKSPPVHQRSVAAAWRSQRWPKTAAAGPARLG
jgi:hypothetical protein